MSDNRDHGRDFLKHVRIVRSPFTQFEGPGENFGNPFPAWVGEACVGLIFDPAILSPDGKRFNIQTNDWIAALEQQTPQKLSSEAAKWLDENILYAGAIGAPAESAEVFGKGRLLEKGQECYK